MTTALRYVLATAVIVDAALLAYVMLGGHS